MTHSPQSFNQCNPKFSSHLSHHIHSRQSKLYCKWDTMAGFVRVKLSVGGWPPAFHNVFAELARYNSPLPSLSLSLSLSLYFSLSLSCVCHCVCSDSDKWECKFQLHCLVTWTMERRKALAGINHRWWNKRDGFMSVSWHVTTLNNVLHGGKPEWMTCSPPSLFLHCHLDFVMIGCQGLCFCDGKAFIASSSCQWSVFKLQKWILKTLIFDYLHVPLLGRRVSHPPCLCFQGWHLLDQAPV